MVEGERENEEQQEQTQEQENRLRQREDRQQREQNRGTTGTAARSVRVTRAVARSRGLLRRGPPIAPGRARDCGAGGFFLRLLAPLAQPFRGVDRIGVPCFGLVSFSCSPARSARPREVRCPRCRGIGASGDGSAVCSAAVSRSISCSACPARRPGPAAARLCVRGIAPAAACRAPHKLWPAHVAGPPPRCWIGRR